MLNMVLFGRTAKKWRNDNPDSKGNIRDEASINQLLVLANIESYNAILIEQGKCQSERLLILHDLDMRWRTSGMNTRTTGITWELIVPWPRACG